MKSVCKKILISLLVFIMIFNFTFTKPVEAAETQGAIQKSLEVVADLGDGVVGLLTYPYKLIGIVAVLVIEGLIGLVAGTFGYVNENGVLSSDEADGTTFFTPDNIFFNKILLTDINIFNISNDQPATIRDLRTNIALWYYIMRVIAVSILLCILIYIAIKMAISTLASDRARYKQMLVNWVSSIALVFVLHYVIVIVCRLNSALVGIFKTIVEGMNTRGDMSIGIGNLLWNCMSVSFTTSMASLAVCGLVIVQTFAFLIYYIKRMLTVSFLIIISPLITITYSIDKLGDGKAQALNTWMKEFFFTIIIQPFHCVIYTVFMSLAITALGANQADGVQLAHNANIFNGGIDGLVGGLLAILCLKFVWDSEKMIKNIFGIKVSETLGDAVASAAVAGTLVNKGMGIAKGAAKGRKAITKVKNGTGTVKDFVSKTKLGNKLGMRSTEQLKQIQNAVNKEGRDKVNPKDIKALDRYNKKMTRQKNRKIRKDNINKFFDENIIGRRFKRTIIKAPSVAAAVLTGGMLYGAGAKTSMVEAGLAGYGMYSGVSGGIRGLLNRKSNNYLDNIEDLGKTMQAALGKPQDGNREMYVQYAETATRMDESGDFKNLKDKADDAKDSIIELLKKHDDEKGQTRDEDAYKEEAEEIMNGLQNGIFNKNLDYEVLAKLFGVTNLDGTLDVDGLRNAVKDFAVDKIYKSMAQENENVNTLSGDDNFYKAALQAWAGKVISEEQVETSNSVDKENKNTNKETTTTTTSTTNKNSQPKTWNANIVNQFKNIIEELEKNKESSDAISKLENILEQQNVLGDIKTDTNFIKQISENFSTSSQHNIEVNSKEIEGAINAVGKINFDKIAENIVDRKGVSSTSQFREPMIKDIKNVFIQEFKTYTENKYIQNTDNKKAR